MLLGVPCILYGQLYTSYPGAIIKEIISKTASNGPFIFSKAGDVILPASGETPEEIATARCVLAEGVAYGGDINVLRPFADIDSRFLSYQLNGKRRIEIARLAVGKSVVHLHNDQLAGLTVVYPSRGEQEKIHSFMSLIDARISCQNKIIDALKSLKSRIKANVVGTLKLFDIAVCQSSTLALRDVKETGLYPVFGANGLCGYSDHYQFDSPGVAIIKDGAGVGRTFVITGGRYSILGTLNLLQPKGVSVNFLDLCLNGIDFRKYIVGSGIPHIYFEDYKVEKVPELNGDNELLSKLASAIEERIGIDTEVLNLFSKQKEYLLKNMFI